MFITQRMQIILFEIYSVSKPVRANRRSCALCVALKFWNANSAIAFSSYFDIQVIVNREHSARQFVVIVGNFRNNHLYANRYESAHPNTDNDNISWTCWNFIHNTCAYVSVVKCLAPIDNMKFWHFSALYLYLSVMASAAILVPRPTNWQWFCLENPSWFGWAFAMTLKQSFKKKRSRNNFDQLNMLIFSAKKYL